MQVVLLPRCLDDYVAEEKPAQVVDVFVDELDLGVHEFEGVDRSSVGRLCWRVRCAHRHAAFGDW